MAEEPEKKEKVRIVAYIPEKLFIAFRKMVIEKRKTVTEEVKTLIEQYVAN